MKDYVFVAVDYWKTPPDMSTLDWALNHFDKDKTKLILTYWSDRSEASRNLFIKVAESTYGPRCIEAQFEFEIRALQVKSAEKLHISELLLQHGMKRLVITIEIKSYVEQAFNENPTLSCKTWFIDWSLNKLARFSVYGPYSFQEAQKEIEEAERVAKEAQKEMEEAKRVAKEAQKETKEAKRVTKETQKEMEEAKRVAKEAQKVAKKVQKEMEEAKRVAKEVQKEMEEAKRVAKEAQKKMEEAKRMTKEETERRKSLEEQLATMSEQVKKNEQKIDGLTQENEQLKQSMAPTTYITIQELEQATDSFSDSSKIGEGGTGSVYRGTFRGTVVAVKKFKYDDQETLSKFQKEVVLLSTVRHPNLVTLIGTCSKPLALVYEFLSNGSLYDYLSKSGKPPLPWQARTRIISEICLALIFLHSNKPEPVIHGDLRPENIFLDSNLTSKLSDFGIMKQAYTDSMNLFRPADFDRIFAYRDPQYNKTDSMIPASDVYSFGMIMLRLLTGNTSLRRFRETVANLIDKKELLTMIDKSAGDWPFDQANEMAKMALWCARDSRKKRPDLVRDVWPVIKDVLDVSR